MKYNQNFRDIVYTQDMFLEQCRKEQNLEELLQTKEWRRLSPRNILKNKIYILHVYLNRQCCYAYQLTYLQLDKVDCWAYFFLPFIFYKILPCSVVDCRCATQENGSDLLWIGSDPRLTRLLLDWKDFFVIFVCSCVFPGLTSFLLTSSSKRRFPLSITWSSQLCLLMLLSLAISPGWTPALSPCDCLWKNSLFLKAETLYLWSDSNPMQTRSKSIILVPSISALRQTRRFRVSFLSSKKQEKVRDDKNEICIQSNFWISCVFPPCRYSPLIYQFLGFGREL